MCLPQCFLLLGAKREVWVSLYLRRWQLMACWPGREAFFLCKGSEGQANAPHARAQSLKPISHKGTWAPWRNGRLHIGYGGYRLSLGPTA